jgi:hypothetical protein
MYPKKSEFEAKDNTIDYGKVNKNDNGSVILSLQIQEMHPLIISNVAVNLWLYNPY